VKVDQIEEIVNILKDTDIYEFKWVNPDIKLFLSRTTKQEDICSEIETSSYDKVSNAMVKEKFEESVHHKSIQIKSKMVGTFYSHPVNSNKDFVKRGSDVKKGQVICITEAMKVIKEIQSEYDGKILDVYMESGQPVEYGQLMFTVVPE